MGCRSSAYAKELGRGGNIGAGDVVADEPRARLSTVVEPIVFGRCPLTVKLGSSYCDDTSWLCANREDEVYDFAKESY